METIARHQTYDNSLHFGATEIEDKSYKADLELLDRYVKFTEEILRLSLLSIAGIVSFISFAYTINGKGVDIKAIPHKGLYVSSLIILCIAVATSLFHRFQSTDGFACHVKYLRAVKTNDKDIARTEAKMRSTQYKAGGYGLIASVGCLIVGVSLFALAIIFAVKG